MTRIWLFFYIIFSTNISAKEQNKVLENAVLALNNSDFTQFKNIVDNRKVGLIQDLSNDDEKNIKEFFVLLGQASQNQDKDFVNWLKNIHSYNFLFYAHNVMPMDFKAYDSHEFSDKNTIFHFLAENTHLTQSTPEINRFWLDLLAALVEKTPDYVINQKNKKGKTYFDILKNRNIDLNAFKVSELIEEAQARYYKSIIMSQLEEGRLSAALNELKGKNKSLQEKILSTSTYFLPDPLVQTLIQQDNYNYASQIITDYPQAINITDKNGNTPLHMLVGKVALPTNKSQLNQYEHFLKKLIKSSNVEQKNADGQTALEIAQKSKNGSEKIIEEVQKEAKELQKKNEQELQKLAEIITKLGTALGDI